MEIRDYIAEEDAELYLEAERESFKADSPNVKITAEKEKVFLARATHQYSIRDYKAFTLQKNQVPIGMIGIHISEECPKTIYIMNIYIQNQYRGTGAVELLLEAAEKIGKEAGARTVILDVSIQNARALSAYRKLGFNTTHQRMMKTL